MARLLRLAFIMLLLCAGVVVAAPVVMTSGDATKPPLDMPTPKPPRNEFVLHVDQRSGCVWRVSIETGKRELTSPCRRPQGEAKPASRLADRESAKSPKPTSEKASVSRP